MTFARRAILALALIAGIAPALAAVPPPVPALPDAERRTSYSISGSTCACAVNFALLGDSNDFQNWVEVFLNGVRVNFNDATFGWTITSPTGPLASIPRPVTDGVLTFTNAQTGTVQIVGALRPRRTSQFAENTGVSARNLNLVITYIISSLREVWDKINDITGRGLFSQPGNTMGPLPLPSACANGVLGFDATGLIPQCRVGGGSGNMTGPLTATAGNAAIYGALPNLLLDAGSPPALTNNNLSDLANKATSRSNLGVAIGSNVEAWDTDLDCLAAISTTGVIHRTGAGTCNAGTVALADIVAGTQDTILGYFGSTAVSSTGIPNCTGALTYSTSTHTVGCNATTAGNVSNSGTPVSNQVAQWVSSTAIQGVNLTSFFVNGAGISITGTTNPTVSRALNEAVLQTSPGSPAGTSSATGVMMGLGTTCKLTPVYSTRIRVEFMGSVENNTSGNTTSINIRYGTGTAPANGVALAGTALLNTVVAGGTGPQEYPFSIGGIITGLTPGTAYWLDMSLAASSNTSTVLNLSCNAMEF